MDAERTINTLRDVVLRRQRDLPMPDGVDVNELLVEAADAIEELHRGVDNDDDYYGHCDGCACND